MSVICRECGEGLDAPGMEICMDCLEVIKAKAEGLEIEVELITPCGSGTRFVKPEKVTVQDDGTINVTIKAWRDKSYGDHILEIDEKAEVFVWPDDSWCLKDDYCEIVDGWRGDDFRTLHVPVNRLSDVDAFIAEQTPVGKLIWWDTKKGDDKKSGLSAVEAVKTQDRVTELLGHDISFRGYKESCLIMGPGLDVTLESGRSKAQLATFKKTYGGNEQ